MGNMVTITLGIGFVVKLCQCDPVLQRNMLEKSYVFKYMIYLGSFVDDLQKVWYISIAIILWNFLEDTSLPNETS